MDYENKKVEAKCV